MNSIANIISSILQVPGDILRDIVLAIDIGVAKGIFILYFLILMVWVLFLPKEEAEFQPKQGGKAYSLKPMTVVSLSIIIVIYLYF